LNSGFEKGNEMLDRFNDISECANSETAGGTGVMAAKLKSEDRQCGSKELEFAIFCIENVASKLHVGAQEVYVALAEQTNILSEYIIPEYEVLHTQSKDYIVDDIIDIMRERGVKL
jgi:hypothetical protein